MTSTELNELVYRKDYTGLRQALEQGANLNATDEGGRTPLMHAVLASDADPEMVRFLIQNGATPNSVDNEQKWTALHFAARDQKLEVVAVLLDAGALVDAEDSFGNTPLWRCVMQARCKPELVRYLLRCGANPLKKNRNGASPKDVAERLGKVELARVLNSQQEGIK